MHTRNGKIARLPASLRNALNERLDQAEESPTLLDWLNALPEVQAVLEAGFNGVPISKQNLSEWRQGGFQEWLLRRDLCDEARAVTESAQDMEASAPGSELVDGVAVVLAARFGGLITRWQGEVDKKTEAQARFLHGLCRSVVRLQRSTHQARHDRFEENRLADEEKARVEKQKKDKWLGILMRPFLYDSMVHCFGNDELGRRYAQTYANVTNGIFVVPPKSPAPKPAEAPQPNASNAEKPLPPNGVEPAPAPPGAASASSPVKPSQTDISSSPDAGSIPLSPSGPPYSSVRAL
jgi:hypothetical protein